MSEPAQSHVGPDLASVPFEKFPRTEDTDGDGLTDRPSSRWKLWASDAATVFCRGVLAGMFPGVGGAIGAVAMTETTAPDTLVLNGGVGFAAGLLIKGLERLHLWQAQPQNEMPNPFRAQP